MTKRRILFVRPSLGTGGADRVTLTLLHGFDREKYTVSLALMRHEGVLLSRVPSDVPILCMNKSSLYKVVPTLCSYYNSGQFDVIYSTSSGMSIPVILASIIARRAKSVITVVSERSSLERRKYGTFKNKVIFKLKCWLTAKADFIVAVSNDVRVELLKFTRANDCQVIRGYNPIIPENLEELKAEEVVFRKFHNANKKIVAIGRLEKVKNFELLLGTFQKINDTSTSLFILGDGPMLESLKTLSNSLGIANRVHFMGYVDNVYAFLGKADAFIMTSDFEGMPGALIQAMACGVACVARDCPTGPSELIQGTKTGFLVAKEDHQRLFLCLESILKDKKKINSVNVKQAVLPYHYKSAIHSYFDFLEA